MFMRELKIKAFIERLKQLTSQKVFDCSDFEYAQCGYKKSCVPEPGLEWSLYSDDVRLLGEDRHYWIKGHIKTPAAQENKEYRFTMSGNFPIGWNAAGNASPQCILYLNSEMIQELDGNHLSAVIEPDTEYDVLIYAYIGLDKAEFEVSFGITETDLRVEKLYYDLLVPYESCLLLDRQGQDYADILKSLDYAVNLVDLYEENSAEFYESVSKASEYMDNHFYKEVCSEKKNKMYCIGQTHIDVAWLWTLAQTREKVQRSFSTVLKLMEKYPEYKFMCSQPQLYMYLKEEAPEVFEKIKEKVKEGRWEIEGAMWLEADCNLSGGESFIRQIIHGKKFIKDEFGVDSKYLWLPDVFGYSAALPQILKKCGVDKFITTKISWNEFNKMPYDTFMWEGLDGTRIFTYFFTEINADLAPDVVYKRWKEDSIQKLYSGDTMIGYGFGDGGGGPTDVMLEKQKRMAHGIPGMPQTVTSSAGDFLNIQEESFKKSCKELNRTPLWVGDLYLEFHRGTYTSVAKVKKHNRKSEFLFQKAESASVIGNILCGKTYPKAEFDKSWKLILLNQFHDIIPGSSIKEVYDDSDTDYEKIFKSGNGIFDGALGTIAYNIKTDGGLLVYNPHGFTANGLIEADRKIMYVENIPAVGYKVVNPTETDSKIKFDKNVCDTPFYRITFDESFNITSLYDKQNGREAVAENSLFNQLRIFEDIPYSYDAWDICEYYNDKHRDINNVENVTLSDLGECFEIEITRKFQSSVIVQTICLYNNIRRIDVKNKIDWKEKKVVLKAMFPINVHTHEAVYDVQFGNVKRSTHKNTSWDRAKFEVCAHKWADVSESGYGVAVMNDCKYGYGCDLNNLSLTLIKCAVYPNTEADRELHEFTYSILPHCGDFREANIAEEAYLLNQPLTVRRISKQDGKLPDSFSFVGSNSSNIIIETVKQCENNDSIIVRFYEYHNSHSKVTLDFGIDFDKAYICDMLENNLNELAKNNRSITLDVKPYEIVTVKITK